MAGLPSDHMNMLGEATAGQPTIPDPPPPAAEGPSARGWCRLGMPLWLLCELFTGELNETWHHVSSVAWLAVSPPPKSSSKLAVWGQHGRTCTMWASCPVSC